jgi:AcrR family transcriptional regulator
LRRPARWRLVSKDKGGVKNPVEAALGVAQKRRHLPAAERERMIVEAATIFFAEHGFEGQTRELAKTMGITHSAIFRYFPTKEALIDRVYEHVYVSRWSPAWAGLIKDRSRPLEGRLIQFYLEYSERIFQYDWVRIFVYSGLKSYSINQKYLDIVRDKFILPVCSEVRYTFQLPPAEVLPVSEREEEAIWALHGKVFYIALRKFVYNRPVPSDVEQIIRDDVQVFMRGIGDLFKKICRV